MPRLVPQSWKTLECVFLKCGFKLDRTTGSHKVYTKPGVLRPVVIPRYDEVGTSIIRGLIRTAGISRDEYLRLLKKC